MGGGGGVTPFPSPGPTGYSPAQIRHAYGFDRINFSGTAADGTGTTIAIVDAFNDPTISSDLTQFDKAFNIPDPPSFSQVNQTGGNSLPPTDNGWAGEIALDVEWAHAIAPGAKILLVEATDNSYGNLLTAETYAASQPGVVAVSNSWGSGEFSTETQSDATFVTPVGHQGVTFVVSSGDSGAPASYPAISPNVLAVGGTTLNLDASGNILNESAWDGSGGGLSVFEVQPAFQQGVVTQSNNARANPDVAYDADPNTGFPVYDTTNNPSSAPWWQLGGTSDAAPQWSALIAIADQGRMISGLPTLNGQTQTLPMLYALPSANDFNDVTTGASFGSPIENAGPGYDLATGRGSPMAPRIVAALSGVAKFAITGAPTTTVAGVSFTVTVTAEDASGNTLAGYSGTVHFTSTDFQAALPADATLTNGVGTFTITLKTAGNEFFTAADAGLPSALGTVGPINVTPAAASHYAVTAPANVTTGFSFNLNVTARDPFNNIDPSYAGTLHFTSTDGAAVLPANATLTNGAGTFIVTLNTLGDQKVTATDTQTASITGTTAAIHVFAPPLAIAESVTVAQAQGTTITLIGSSPNAHALVMAVLTQPAHGRVTGFNVSSSQLSYKSAAGYVGPDSFTFSVTDSVTHATVTNVVSVTVALPPSATPGQVAVAQSVTRNFTLAGTAPNGDLLKFTLMSLPAHGTLGPLNPLTGQVTYTPTGDYLGADSFAFTVTDTTTTLTSGPANVNFTVSAGRVPVAQFGTTGVWQFNRGTGAWTQLTASNARLLAADPLGDVVAEFPGYGLWEIQAGAGWKQIHPVDVTLLTMDVQGDVVAEFPGYGVGLLLAGSSNWRTLTPSNATLLAIDAGGDVTAEFPGYGLWEIKPGNGWVQLNGVDVTLLAMDVAGDVAANFPGYGVGEFKPGKGWALLNGIQASALTLDPSGNIVANFPGYGVSEYRQSIGSWQPLTAANALLLSSDGLGNIYGEFVGFGVWQYDSTHGWVQVRTTDASLLAAT
jgi:hypothetical protein